MEHNINMESGLQFLSRIKLRPSLRNIENTLFPNGLSNSETVEICGNSSSGKTLLLTQLIAKCILPIRYEDKLIEGLGINVVFINIDHHFMMLKLRDLLVEILNKNEKFRANPAVIETVVKQSLKKLIIINCYTSWQYSLTLQTLNHILLKHDEIGLVAIDSIVSYYWEDRENGGDWLVDRYIKNILKIIQTHTFTSKIPLIYTKPTYNNSVEKKTEMIKCVNESILGEINYRINLIRSDDSNRFTCTVKSHDNNVEMNYVIGINGITWHNERKCKIESLST